MTNKNEKTTPTTNNSYFSLVFSNTKKQTNNKQFLPSLHMNKEKSSQTTNKQTNKQHLLNIVNFVKNKWKTGRHHTGTKSLDFLTEKSSLNAAQTGFLLLLCLLNQIFLSFCRARSLPKKLALDKK
jgi:hypothetical protein